MWINAYAPQNPQLWRSSVHGRGQNSSHVAPDGQPTQTQFPVLKKLKMTPTTSNQESSKSIEKEIFNLIGNPQYDENKVLELMSYHYKILNLLKVNGDWANQNLNNFSIDLLPKNISKEYIHLFLMDITGCIEQNIYLSDFLKNITEEDFYEIKKTFEKFDTDMVNNIIAYLLVLNNLTKIIYFHPEILKDCATIFDARRKELNSLKHSSWRYRIKFLSVNLPIKKIILKSHRTGIVNKTSGKFILILNIFEAVIFDLFSWNTENAKTGLVLIFGCIGFNYYNFKIKEAVLSWSNTKKVISFKMLFPKEWVDLYQTWNMAFVSQFEDFPYFMVKLLIPQVACYKERPDEYLYNRTISLYLFLNHEEFNRASKSERNNKEINWGSISFAKIWGTSNFKNAKKYFYIN